ncbi:MAG: DUF2267 domain-containing protein [Roseibium sp.]
MPMPSTYQRSSEEWRSFLNDIRDLMDLESNNMAYTAVDAVLQVFRSRLTAQQGLDFASALPAVLRAIFVKDWRVQSPPKPFAARSELLKEVQAVRRHHNLTPVNAIEAVAAAVRGYVDPLEFERALAGLPAEAQAFWSIERPQECGEDDPEKVD